MPTTTLGCVTDYNVFITGRCGSPRMCQLLEITSLNWSRTLDNFSTAQVVVGLPTGSVSSDPCCTCLADTEPWCHELQIYRDDELVWIGPIIKVTYGYETATIDAKDVLAWLDVRYIASTLLWGIAPPAGVFILQTSVTTATGGTYSITIDGTPVLGIPWNATGAAIQSDILAAIPALSGILTVPGTTDINNSFALSFEDLVSHTVTANGAGLTGPNAPYTIKVSHENPVLPPTDITEIADIIIELATAAQEDTLSDTCIFENVIRYATPPDSPLSVTQWQAQAFQETAFAMLQALSQIGLDFTAYGRSIILSAYEHFQVPNLRTLTSEMILGELSVVKDGDLMGNDFFMRWNQDGTLAACTLAGADTVPCPVEVSTTQPYCYGLVQRLKTDTQPADQGTARGTGELYLQASQIVPRTITFPSDTLLSPETPWGINEMIPGMFVNVALEGLCINVSQTFRLTDVKVTMDATNGEKIGISLSALNTSTGNL